MTNQKPSNFLPWINFKGLLTQSQLQHRIALFSARSVVHDVSEIAGLSTHSFGEEDVDRHIQVCVKDRQSLIMISELERYLFWSGIGHMSKGVEERVQPMWGRACSLKKRRGVGPGDCQTINTINCSVIPEYELWRALKNVPISTKKEATLLQESLRQIS